MVQVYLERVDEFVQEVTAVKSCLLLTLMSFALFCCNESYPDTSHVQRMYSLMYVLFHLLHYPLVLCLLFKFSLSVSFSSIPFLILCLVFKLSLSVSSPQPSAYSPTPSQWVGSKSQNARLSAAQVDPMGLQKSVLVCKSHRKNHRRGKNVETEKTMERERL